MIHLTDRAAEEIEKIVEEQNIKSPKLRFGVKGGGCSGFKYVFEFCDITDEYDTTFIKKRNDRIIEIVVDQKSYLFAHETTIDFEEDLLQRGFKFNNPLATMSCGCGESFGV